MREDFAAFILTHKRADNQITIKRLRSHGYTGKVYLVVDNEDPTLDRYRELYGDQVLVFDKPLYADRFDDGDNAGDRRTILHARNASYDLARGLGLRYFVQLDDDYRGFYYRFDAGGFYGNWKLDSLDWLFSAFCDYLSATPFVSIAMSQGGDHIGGGQGHRVIGTKRKAMNSFFCDVEKPVEFLGRFNEDVNTYVSQQRKGAPFLTLLAAQLNQAETQSQEGGLTELYRDSGTYVKAFFSVMYEPSAVRIALLGDTRANTVGHDRLHHRVNWNACAPCIIEEQYRRTR